MSDGLVKLVGLTAVSGALIYVLRKMKASKNAPKILISGAPGAGKGTQCEKIVAKYGVVHLSTGDMLRAAVKAGTPLGKKAKSFMDRGALVPDELIIGIVQEKLLSAECQEKGWLLDGFPRTAAQAQALRNSGIEPDVLLQIEVPDAVLTERVVHRRLDPVTDKIYHLKFKPPPADIVDRLTHRKDDTAEKLVTRLAAYHKNVADICGMYENVQCIIDGNRAPSDVFADICCCIDSNGACCKQGGACCKTPCCSGSGACCCTEGGACKCGADCKCAQKKAAACTCTEGGACSCGADCKCAQKKAAACTCTEGGACSCGADCKCAQKKKACCSGSSCCK